MKRNLKRIFSVLLIISISLVIVPSCDSFGASAGSLSKYFAGEMLELTVQVTNGMGNKDSAEVMANSVGMSGMYAPNQLHSNADDEMYITKANAEDVAFTFKILDTEPVGRVFIWNYCVSGDETAGLNKVTASYSLNGDTYTDIGKFEISIGDSSGEESYSAVIDFGGVAAKYIRLTPDSQNGNHGDSNGRYGLAEVRAYRFKTHPENKGDVIVSQYQETDGGSTVTNGTNITNNRGMSGALSANDKHSNDPDDMALMDISSGNRSFIFTLDGTYPVDKIYIWNYNDPDNLDACIKNAKIYYSPDGITYKAVKTQDDEKVHTLSQASGKDGISATDVIDVGGANAGYIKIEVQKKDGTYGGESMAGLSEIRVTAAKGWAVEPARDWTGLFSRQEGWLAADGIFTVNLNGYDIQGSINDDSKTLFIFSDTAIGSIDYTDMSVNQTGFVNHTFAYLTGDEPDPKNIKFVLENPTSGGNIFGDSIWLTDVIRVTEGSVRIGGFKFNSNWGADRMDMATVAISDSAEGFLNLSRMAVKQGVAMQYKENGQEVLMVSGYLNESKTTGNPNGDGYIYMYGFRNDGSGKKNLVVARSLPEDFDSIDSWEYYTGTEWEKGIATANTSDAHICKDDVSSELSVTYITSGMFKGKYMLIYTASTMGPSIRFALSDTPEGPFEEITPLYYCPEESIYKNSGDEGFYTYNCKAHPNLSKEGELLISYNLNSTTNYGIDTYRYHPEFLRMYEIK